MIEITKNEAHSKLDKIDLEVIDHELDNLFYSNKRNEREMTSKYYLEEGKTIVLKILWDKKEVALYRF